MATSRMSNYAGLTPAELAALEAMTAAHGGLDDIFAWGRRQSPVVVPVDIVKQDEFTHDVLLPLPGDRWLVYGTT
jgi:hypothetical protein